MTLCRVQYGKYFPSCSYFATYLCIIAEYEKQGKYLPILHEKMCDNYFIVKCLLKSNESREILLTNCIELASKMQKQKLQVPTLSGHILYFATAFFSIFQFEYFVFCSFVWYSMVFCNWFIFECFAPNIRLLFKTCTY